MMDFLFNEQIKLLRGLLN